MKDFVAHSTSSKVQRENYPSLDGLRAYAMIGILSMHVLANMAVKPTANIVTERIIPWLGTLTLLFMVISAFSMCCGYYERIRSGSIQPSEFYAKRYKRTWPFFALMVVISFAVEPSWATFCQSFANLTLCFNLLPNPDIQIVGVGWFVGVVFTFYMLFPFFTFLLDNKRRAWMALLVSIIFCYISIAYFSTPDKVARPIGKYNIIYSAPFFIAGGVIYLYRKNIVGFLSKYKVVMPCCCILLTVLPFAVSLSGFFVLPDLAVFSAWLVYAVCSHDAVLNNRVVKYLSGISMEVYLCHMMLFRATSMLHLENYIANANLLYIATVAVTLGTSILFSHFVKYVCFPYIGKRIKRAKKWTH